MNLRAPSVSADGHRIYYAAVRRPDARPDDATNLNEWRMTASSPEITKLTNFDSDGAFAGVTSVHYPGMGERLVYTALPTGSEGAEELHVFHLTNQTDRTIAVNTTDCVQVDCVDCFKACLRSAHLNDAETIVLYEITGTSPFHTVTTDGTNDAPLPVWRGNLSPSPQRVMSQGGMIVFTSSAPVGDTFVPIPADVYRVSLDGQVGPVQVTNFIDPMFAAHDAVISKDGSMIAFVANYSESGVVEDRIWAVRPDGSDLHPLSFEGGPASRPSISDDGNWVTFIQDGKLKYMSTAIGPNVLVAPPLTLVEFLVSEPQDAVITGDGAFAVFTLGPISGEPAAVYRVPTAETTPFADMTEIFAPRFLYESGVVSSAGTGPASPGSLITAYGANLSTEEYSAATAFPLPEVMGQLSLLVNGDPMPLHAVTPWQINAHLPQTASEGTGLFRIAYQNGIITTGVNADIDPYRPDMFIVPTQASIDAGYQQAAAIHPDTGAIVDPNAPAAPGEAIAFFLVGLGRTIPEIAPGIASPSDPPAETIQTTRVEIGGVEAAVLFSGLAPGYSGVYQVNVTVPGGLAPGVHSVSFVLPGGQRVFAGAIYIG